MFWPGLQFSFHSLELWEHLHNDLCYVIMHSLELVIKRRIKFSKNKYKNILNPFWEAEGSLTETTIVLELRLPVLTSITCPLSESFNKMN